MSQVIRIPISLYNRLSSYAKGFDTPASVIEKMLDFYEKGKGLHSSAAIESENKKPLSLEIIYSPSNEDEFKKALLQTQKAYILLHKVDGTTNFKEWNASNFGVNSDVNSNLRSGYLRGWKNKGIFKAEISTNKNDFMNTNQEKLSMEIHKIISVEIVSGSSLNSRWRNDMQRIKTDKGTYIDNIEGVQFGFFKEANPGYNWSSMIGKTVRDIKIFSYGDYLWLNKK